MARYKKAIKASSAPAARADIGTIPSTQGAQPRGAIPQSGDFGMVPHTRAMGLSMPSERSIGLDMPDDPSLVT